MATVGYDPSYPSVSYNPQPTGTMGSGWDPDVPPAASAPPAASSFELELGYQPAARKQPQPTAPVAAPAASANQTSLSDKLDQLEHARNTGRITADEYRVARRQALQQGPPGDGTGWNADPDASATQGGKRQAPVTKKRPCLCICRGVSVFCAFVVFILAVVQIALPAIRVKQSVSLVPSVPPEFPEKRDCGTVDGMRLESWKLSGHSGVALCTPNGTTSMSWDALSAAGRAVVFPDSIGSFRANSTVLGGSESALKRCLTVSIVLLIGTASALVLRLFVWAKAKCSQPLPAGRRYRTAIRFFFVLQACNIAAAVVYIVSLGGAKAAQSAEWEQLLPGKVNVEPLILLSIETIVFSVAGTVVAACVSWREPTMADELMRPE